MPSFQDTSLWKNTLSDQVDDLHKTKRESLRASYEKLRERTSVIAATISHDLREYTVHDVSHSDALWEYADLLAGEGYPLNPCEAYVLGAAFLIHDWEWESPRIPTAWHR